jgi:hypothetical protein
MIDAPRRPLSLLCAAAAIDYGRGQPHLAAFAGISR